jgi:hypothetical protein
MMVVSLALASYGTMALLSSPGEVKRKATDFLESFMPTPTPPEPTPTRHPSPTPPPPEPTSPPKPLPTPSPLSTPSPAVVPQTTRSALMPSPRPSAAWPPPLPHSGRTGKQQGLYYALLSNETNTAAYVWLVRDNKWQVTTLLPGQRHWHGWPWPEDALVFPCTATGERFRKEGYQLRTVFFDHKLIDGEQSILPKYVLSLGDDGLMHVYSQE